MAGGRPTKYRPEMCEKVRAGLADGYSLTACAGALGVSYSTLVEWRKQHPEFAQALEEGEAASQRWWEDRGRRACADPESGQFNAHVWAKTMQNRFGYRDKVSQETSLDLADELRNKLKVVVFGKDGVEDEPKPE